jgi:hypothetical protein
MVLVLVVADDVEKGFQPGLDSGIGGVRVDLQDQIGFRSHFGGEHGVGKGVDGATEVADAQQEQVWVLLGDRHGIQNLVRKVPGGGTLSDRQQTVGGDHRARPYWRVSCPPIATLPA